MSSLFKRLIFLSIVLISLMAHASDSLVVHFTIDKVRMDDKSVVVNIRASVPKGIKLYALQKSPDDALYSSIEFDSSSLKYLAGSADENGSVKKERDTTVDAAVRYFTDSVLWRQKLNVAANDSLTLSGRINWMF